MNSNAQILFDHSPTVRTFLAGAVRVNLAVVDISLPAHPRENLVHKLSQSSIQGMFTERVSRSPS
jgi:hypothetical protein